MVGAGAELAGARMAGDHMAPCFLVGRILGLLLAFVNILFFDLFGILLGPMVPSPVVQGPMVASPVVHHLGGFQLLDLIITELQSHMTC